MKAIRWLLPWIVPLLAAAPAAADPTLGDPLVQDPPNEDMDPLEQPLDDGPLTLPVLGETTFSLTNTSILEWRRDPAQSEGGYALVLTEKLDVAAQGEEIRLSLRADAFAPFMDAGCERPAHSLCTLEYDLRVPERASLLWEPGDVTVELGDSYAVFGRGLALSFRKVDLLGIDTTLRGGHVRYARGRLGFTVLGGLANPQNLDPIQLTVADDPTDVVAGLSSTFRLGPDEELEVGVHGARVWFEPGEGGVRDVTATVFGWRASSPALLDGQLVLYGEADGMVRDDANRSLSDGRFWGRAIYASAQLALDRLSILVEWKDYRDFLLAPTNSLADEPWRVYSAAPTLDRDTERFRGVHNSRGAAVEVGYAFLPGPWSASVHGTVYGHEDEDRRTDPWDGILTAHVYGTVRRAIDAIDGDELGWAVELTGGVRRETYLTDPEFPEELRRGDLDWRVYHVELDASVALGDHAIELSVEHRAEKRMLFDYVEYIRGGVSLTYSWAGVLSLGPILRWDTEKEGLGLSTFFPGGEVKWEFLDGSHLRVFGGRTPGGRICSGGVCRDVPPFQGALAELVVRL